MKTIIILAAITLLCIISSSNANRLFYNNDDDMELSDQKARMFLRAMTGEEDDDDVASFDTRESGKNCVKCKFGINPCCAPNICIKKSFRPDECMEIKTGK
jgi:hypothetical protein